MDVDAIVAEVTADEEAQRLARESGWPMEMYAGLTGLAVRARLMGEG